jgi:GT2 family glycosyltransferase
MMYDDKRSAKKPLVAVVLVNWQRPDLTIGCLESLWATDYPNFVSIVCDNGSRDESLARIQTWAAGRTRTGGLKTESAMHSRNGHRRFAWANLPSEELTSGFEWPEHPWTWLYLIKVGRNLGFAGGVNAGIRLALANEATEFVWILNNDTVVAPDCLSRMVSRLTESPTASMCGSRILLYDRPEIVQALGGARFWRWASESRLIGAGTRASDVVNVPNVEKALDHLLGASMLVRRRFLEDVGPMEESYFAYYEEIDWVTRARGRCQMVYADKAIVYHRVGASSGYTPISAFYFTRSRILFTRKFYPWALPTVITFCAARAAQAYCLGYRRQAAAMVAALCGKTPPDRGWIER